jgi:cyanate lyase
MKKIIFILFLINMTFNNSYGMAKEIVHYFNKRLDPDGYILDLKNKELYENLLAEMDVKDIGELMRNESFSKGIDKQSQERIHYLISCLIQASKTQSHKNLASMVDINAPLISDIHLILAMKALSEHSKKTIEIETQYPRVNALLYRFSKLNDQEQKALKQTLRIQEETLELSQKIHTAEQLLEGIPNEARVSLFLKFVNHQKENDTSGSSDDIATDLAESTENEQETIEDNNTMLHKASDSQD